MAFETGFESQFIPENGYTVEPLVTIGETIPNTTGALNSSTAGDFQPTGILDGAGAIAIDDDTVRAFVNSELQDFEGNSYTITNGTEDPSDDYNIIGGRISYFDININTFEIEDAGIAYNTIIDANGNIGTPDPELAGEDVSFAGNFFGEVFAEPGNPDGGFRTVTGFSRFCSGGLTEANEFGEGRGIVDNIYFAGEEVGGFFNNIGGGNWALDVATGEFHQVPALARGSWENTTQIDTGTDDFVAFILADDQSPFNFDGDETTGDNGNEVAPLYLYVGQKDASEDAGFLAKNGLEDGNLYVFVPNENLDDDDTNDVLTATQFNGAGSSLNGSWVLIDNFQQADQASTDGSTGFDMFGYPTQANLFTQAADVNALGVSRPEDVATNPNNPSQVAQALTGVDTLAVDPETGNGADTFGQILVIDTLFGEGEDNILNGVTNLAEEVTAIDGEVTIVYDGDEDPTRALRSPDNLDWSADGFIYVQEDEAEEDTLSGDEVLFGQGAANPFEASIVRLNPSDGVIDDIPGIDAAPTGGNIQRIGQIDRTQILDPSVPDPTTAVDEDFEFGPDDGIPSANDIVLDSAANGDGNILNNTSVILNAGEWETSGIVDVSDLFGEADGTIFLFDVQAHGLADQDDVNLEQGDLSALTDDNLVEGGQLLLLGPDGFFDGADPGELFQTEFASQVIPAEGFDVLPLVTIGETIPNTTGALNSSTAGDFQPTGILDGAGAILIDDDTIRAFVNSELQDFEGNSYTITNGTEDTSDDYNIIGGRISYFDININTFGIEDSGVAYNTIIDANGNIGTPDPALAGEDVSFAGNFFGEVFATPGTDADGFRTVTGFSRFCSGGLVEANEFGENQGIVDDIYFAGEEVGGFFNNIGGANWALDVATGVIHQVPALARGSWENTTQIDTGTEDFVAFILADDQSPFNFDGDETTGDNGNEVAPLYLYIGQKDTSEDAGFLAKNGLEDGNLYVFVPGVNQDEVPDNDVLTAAQFNGAGSQLDGAWVLIDNFQQEDQASTDGSTGFDMFGYPTQANLFTQAAAAGALGVSRPEDVATNPNNPSQVAQALTGVDTLAVDPETGNGADTFGQILLLDTFFGEGEGNILNGVTDLATDLTEVPGLVTIAYDGDEDPTRALRSPDNLDFSGDGFIYIQEDEAEEDTLSGDEVLFGAGAVNPNEASIVRLDVNGLDTTDPDSVAAFAVEAATGANVELVAVVDRTQILDPSVPDPTTAVDEDFEAGDDDGIPSPNDIVLDAAANGDGNIIPGDNESVILNAGEAETSGIVDVSDLFGFEEPGSVFLFDVQYHGLADQDDVNLEQGDLSALTDDNLVEGGQLLLLFAPGVNAEAVAGTSVVGTAGDDSLDGGVDFAPGDTVITGAGDDEIDSNLASNLPDALGDGIILSGSGADAIFTSDDDLVFGGTGDDALAVLGEGARVSGGAGIDSFIFEEEASNNRVLGGEGDDIFTINSGSDNLLSGGEGADSFSFVIDEPVADNVIVDFDAAIDSLEIVDLGGIGGELEFDGSDVIFGGVTIVTLIGVDAATAGVELV